MANLATVNPGLTVAKGITDVLEAFAPKQPTASEINEQVKSRGTTLASQHISQYNRILESQGMDKADSWLNKQAVKSQASLGASGSEAYRTTLKSFLGGIPMNQELEEQREAAAAEAQNRRNAIELGRELVLTSGANPESFSEEDLYLRGQSYQGRQSMVQLQKQEYQLQSARLNAEEAQLEANTRAGIDTYRNTLQTTLDARMQEYADAVAQNNGTSVELKAEFMSDLRQLRADLNNSVQEAVNGVGGSWSMVDTQQVTQLENMLSNTEKLIQGEYLIDLQNVENKRILVGQATEFLQMNEGESFVTRLGLSQLPGVQTNVDITQADTNAVRGGSGRRLENDILMRSMEGMATAGAQLGASPEDVSVPYRKAGRTLASFKRTDPSYQKRSAAEFFVNSLFEGTTGRRKVRALANSRQGVPLMLKEAASMERGALAQEILEQAEAEGSTPQEVFTGYYNQMIRGTLVPSLRINDEDFIKSVQVQDQGGRISLSFDRQAYNSRTRGNRRGRQDTASQVDSAALDKKIKRIRQLEAELNKYTGAYSQIMDADSSDVTAAMVQTLKAVSGMVDPEEVQAVQREQERQEREQSSPQESNPALDQEITF